MSDDLVRVAAAVAAAALVAGPYWRHIKAACARAAEAVAGNGWSIARAAAAAFLIGVALGRVPMPAIQLPARVPAVNVETPSAEMQRIVADVGQALRGLNAVDRSLWADTWNKAALVAAGDVLAKEIAFTDTRSLRLFTSLALDIAWRRIGGKEPGSQETLRVAVESAYSKAMGVKEVPVTTEIRGAFAEFARAMAWAGINRG